ncbi:MAG: protein tyrosine phosphatase [Planctomycetia bacterium]|nr:protein tyrosine phosphatase [Planctomycetia bacterium]
MLHMLPLVDVHCHLLAGLDDGPQDWEQAIAMCRIAWEDGTRAIAATAHQNDHWPDVTPQRILEATGELRCRLEAERIPLAVYPAAEVMIWPDLENAFEANQLLSVSDLRRYLLIELPTGMFFDLRDMVTRLMELGVRPILVHPERHPELLHGVGVVEELIFRGCLIQVTADSVTQNQHPQVMTGLRSWARRNIIHLIGSDGHSPIRRVPGVSAAYKRLGEWAGWAAADRICSSNGLTVLEGRPLQTPRPAPAKRRWFTRA